MPETPILPIPPAFPLNHANRYGLPKRTAIYQLLAAGKLEAVKDGRRTLITGESAARYLTSLPKWQPSSRVA